MLPRDGAASFDLQGGTGGIITMCPLKDCMEVYKVDRTFRIQTPETLDPGRSNPKMPWVIDTVDVGTGNHIVARILIQGKEILESAIFLRRFHNENAIFLLHGCKEILLRCEEISNRVNAEVNSIIDLVKNKQIKAERGGRVLSSFPQVKNLESEAVSFLTHAKQYTQKLVEIFNLFFQTRLKGPHMHKVLDELKKFPSIDPMFVQFVEANQKLFLHYLNLRNFQEHPTASKKTHIKNFKLLPSNEIDWPAWWVTDTPDTAIHNDMAGIMKFLLEFTQVFFINCVATHINKGFSYHFQQIPDGEQNTSCPIQYRLHMGPPPVSQTISR